MTEFQIPPMISILIFKTLYPLAILLLFLILSYHSCHTLDIHKDIFGVFVYLLEL